MLCFTSYGSYIKGFKQQKWPLRSSKGIGNGAILQATCDFLLVFYCNYVSILHRFRDIITYFVKFKDVTWLWTHPFWEKYIMHTLVLLCINQYTKFEVANYKDVIGAKFKNTGYVTITTSLCHHRLGFNTVQSCPWVHFLWPNLTQPISWKT